ncbi:HNH endonuclease signature motif containing protein [Hyphomonas sp.]|uniref:HNH endonuclease signature motif containing protein n=1 Tax=Hyphomonas sp. TaxID=87 RepID=UPI00391B01B5
MAKAHRKIPKSIKRELINRAGNKCSNPGCSNWRVHIHHIQHWAVYGAHHAEHMIAVCPSCHDDIHHGILKLTDEDLYEWRGIRRSDARNIAQLFVEPSTEIKLLAGTICLKSQNSGLTVFEFSNRNLLSFLILDGDILRVNARVADRSGRELVRVMDNVARTSFPKLVDFEQRAGRVRVSISDTSDFVPDWVVSKIRHYEPAYCKDGMMVMFDLEVVRPGVVRVRGCWPAPDRAVVISDEALYFCEYRQPRPIALCGDGEESVICFTGPLNSVLFGF